MALTLRIVAGLTVPEIALAFLVQETTIGRRITRAKAKMKAARIPYRVPSAEDLPARVSGVLAILFLVFDGSYLATGPGTDPVRHDLIAEAIRLTRLIRALMPEDGEVAGLLALLLLTEARHTARVSASGELVTLCQRARPWDLGPGADRRGSPAGARAPGRGGPSRVATRSSQRSAPVHTSARDVRDTDWSQVVALSTSSSASIPPRSSPSTGPSRWPSSTARRWHWRPSTVSRTTGRLSRLPCDPRRPARPRRGRIEKSRAAYDKAIELAGNTAEIACSDTPPRPLA